MTLALHGKTRQRQAALLFAGFLAVIAGSLYALTTQGDEAKAANVTFNPSLVSCVNAGGNACSVAAGALNTVDNSRVRIDTISGSGPDVLNVVFDLSAIPAGSTINTASLTVVTDFNFGGCSPTYRISTPATVLAYNTWSADNSENYTVTLTNFNSLAADVAAAAGGTFTLVLGIFTQPTGTACGTDVDQVSMTIDWTPPPPAASGTKTSDEAGSDGTVDVGEDFNWVITVTVANGNTTGHTEISDTIQSPLVIRGGTWDLDDGTGAGTLTCPDQTGPDIWCRVNSGAAPGTYIVKIPVEVPTGVAESVCAQVINNTAVLSGPDVSGSPVSVVGSVDLNPCPPTRTVRVVKVTNTPDHDGGTFGGSILPGQISPSAETTWAATLTANADDNAPGESFETSQTAQTVTETAPAGDWFHTGFAEVSDTGQTACPAPASGNYTADGIVPAGSGDVLVCVRNTYVAVTYEKSDTGDGTYAPGENINWEITATVTGGPTVSSIAFEDALPSGLEFAGFTWLDAGICAFNDDPDIISCDFGVRAAGEYRLRFVLRAPLADPTCGQIVNEVRRRAADGGALLTSHTVSIDCPSPFGSLRVEKYIDINRDGDADDEGEGLYEGWPITIEGPDINGTFETGEFPHPANVLQFNNLDPDDFYFVGEATLPGWVVVKSTINGVDAGAFSAHHSIDIPDGGTTVVRFYNSPSGSITVHKDAINVANGIETANLNDDDGWRITATSAACGVAVSGVTDANGNITFSGLERCDDYVVAEDLSVPGAPGYSAVGGSSRTGIQPGFSEPTLVTFTNETRSTTAPCPNCSGTGPTTNQATPVATPATPAATATTPATPPATPTAVPATPTAAPSSPTPDGALGGQQPAGVITPVAPSTGDHLASRDNEVSLLVIFAGALATVAGAGAFAMGSRR